MEVSVIGLGKLGSCTATCFASKSHKVIGVDINKDVLNLLKNRICTIKEKGLAELLNNCYDNMIFTDDYLYAVNNSEITLIIVPTPSEPDGRFSNSYIEKVIHSISTAIKGKNSFHIVDIVSTVMPGSCDKVFKPMLERLTNKVCAKDFGLVYNPEFIAIGSVIENFLNPDMVLIGSYDEKSAKKVKELYSSTCENKPYFAIMSPINAEITKLALNCYVTMKISFANELSKICENVDGADVDVITDAIGADTRIGRKYLTGGLGFGGPCFPRDNLAFIAFAKEIGLEAKLSPKVVEVNNEVVDRLFNKISSYKSSGKVAILGLSYKPGTHIIEEAQSIHLAKKLVKNGYELSVHDPQALDETKLEFGDLVKYYVDIYDCIKGADAIILMTPWEIYKEIDCNKMEKLVNNGAILIDCWRIMKEKKFKKIKYFPIGINLYKK